ncbi:hypothetical protein VIGAN_UM132100 [Vigna angularis var. angularis]|uniref:Uncharacterized protein n=1 Tax=Vigna angularis var. angularis TaxID=157739 RepID=A0A0S3TEL5_PHAAN|nr:hypothetical protein VIGAN_UM132100 [Vigna angularis var. angularis]
MIQRGHSNHQTPKTNTFKISQNLAPSTNLANFHHQTWLASKPTKMKNFLHQDFYSSILMIQRGHSNHQTPKTNTFKISQNLAPSTNLANFHHQTWLASKPTKMKNFLHQDFYSSILVI